jgi:hypothetical protein
MNIRSQTICAWCGILCPIVMFTGFWPLAQFFPPHLPAATAGEIVELLSANVNGVRTGAVLIIFAGAMYGTFSAAIASQMRRIEIRETPVLTYTQLAGGIGSMWLFVIPGVFWAVAAYRLDRQPDVTQALNDIAWFVFVMPFIFSFIQNLALGFLILSDTAAEKLFPRWVGFFNLWISFLLIPAGLLPFFKEGPFAWNGVLAFWIPAGVFGPWFFIVGFAVLNAIKKPRPA